MSKVESSNVQDDTSKDKYKTSRKTLPRVVFHYTQSEEISKEESKHSHSQIMLKDFKNINRNTKHAQNQEIYIEEGSSLSQNVLNEAIDVTQIQGIIEEENNENYSKNMPSKEHVYSVNESVSLDNRKNNGGENMPIEVIENLNKSCPIKDHLDQDLILYSRESDLHILGESEYENCKQEDKKKIIEMMNNTIT